MARGDRRGGGEKIKTENLIGLQESKVIANVQIRVCQ